MAFRPITSCFSVEQDFIFFGALFMDASVISRKIVQPRFHPVEIWVFSTFLTEFHRKMIFQKICPPFYGEPIFFLEPHPFQKNSAHVCLKETIFPYGVLFFYPHSVMFGQLV